MNTVETRAALARFYDAMTACDAETMAKMYAEDATFEDEVFRLSGSDIGKMWIGLLKRARGFSLAYTIAQAGNGRGAVEWTARYLYGGKRPVVNVILSEIEFDGEKIAHQVDHFDFPRWLQQALGPWARFLARFKWFRRAIWRKAASRLDLPPKT